MNDQVRREPGIRQTQGSLDTRESCPRCSVAWSPGPGGTACDSSCDPHLPRHQSPTSDGPARPGPEIPEPLRRHRLTHTHGGKHSGKHGPDRGESEETAGRCRPSEQSERLRAACTPTSFPWVPRVVTAVVSNNVVNIGDSEDTNKSRRSSRPVAGAWQRPRLFTPRYWTRLPGLRGK